MSKPDETIITFPAAVYKVQTMVDGGVRVTLDLPETAIMQMAQLAECQRQGIYLIFSAGLEETAKSSKISKVRRNGKETEL